MPDQVCEQGGCGANGCQAAGGGIFWAGGIGDKVCGTRCTSSADACSSVWELFRLFREAVASLIETGALSAWNLECRKAVQRPNILLSTENTLPSSVRLSPKGFLLKSTCQSRKKSKSSTFDSPEVVLQFDVLNSFFTAKSLEVPSCTWQMEKLHCQIADLQRSMSPGGQTSSVAIQTYAGTSQACGYIYSSFPLFIQMTGVLGLHDWFLRFRLEGGVPGVGASVSFSVPVPVRSPGRGTRMAGHEEACKPHWRAARRTSQTPKPKMLC